MLRTSSIEQIAVDNPAVFAFRIHGEVKSGDMAEMARKMNAAFDNPESVSMLLVFENYEGTEAGAGWDMETWKSQFRSLAKVDKYAVVGAPSFAEALINISDKLIPADARTFDRSEEVAAWHFVRARPIVPGGISPVLS